MSLFGKKRNIRFETITVDRERDVFRALENKGWTLCTDPFQFDVQKSHEKLRKDALRMAKELHAELLVEVWDPIYQHMHWKGLKYAAWRMATREELIEREKAKKAKERPDYSDSLGSYDTIAQKLEEKKIHVDQSELHQYDNVLVADTSQMTGEVYGNSDEDMGMVTEHFDTVSSFNPYDHQGELQAENIRDPNIDQQAASTGPVFDETNKLEIGVEPSVEADQPKEIDPLALMMEAAPPQEAIPQPTPQEQLPRTLQPSLPPMAVQPAQPPQVAQLPQPPAVAPQAQPPMNAPPAAPPALGAPPPMPPAASTAQNQGTLPPSPAQKMTEDEDNVQ